MKDLDTGQQESLARAEIPAAVREVVEA